MTVRDVLLSVALGAFALAALSLWRAARRARRQAPMGRRSVWAGLILRGILVALLIAIGVASLRAAPPPDLVNRPAPAAAGALVAFVQNTRDGASRTIQAVSARDGTTRWTRGLGGAIESLLSPTPNIILAQMYDNGVCTLRARNGDILWCYRARANMATGPVTAMNARVYLTTPATPTQGIGATDVIALDALTGTVIWQASLPVVIKQARVLTTGDGLVVVAGESSDSGSAYTPWEIVAMSAADGVAQWTKAGDAGAGTNTIVHTLILAGGNVIVEAGTGLLTALRERDGTRVWNGPDLPAGANPTSALNDVTSDGAVVYVMSHAFANGSDGSITNFPVQLLALDARSGSILWNKSLDRYLPAGELAVSDGVLMNGVSVTATTGFEGLNPGGSLLTAYDAASGAQLWRDNSPPTGISWDFSSQMTPVGGNGAVYLMGIQSDPYLQHFFTCAIFCPGVSWLYAVNVRTGAPWWRISTGYVQLAHLVF